MSIFWFTLFSTYMLSAFARIIKNNKLNLEFNLEKKPSIYFTSIVFIVLALVSGFRNNIGDTYTYKALYTMTDYNWSEINYKEDFGFYVLQILLKDISNDPQILIITSAFITNFLIVITLRNYSRPFELSIFLYITLGMYLVTMNGMRQYLAAAIIFYAWKYIFKGNFKKYLIVTLIASTIHLTGLIMIPVYFMVTRKAWSWITTILFTLMIGLTFSFNQFTTILYDFLKETQYGHYSEFDEGGASIFRAIIHLIPIIFAFIGRKELRAIWMKSDIIVNLSILNFLFYIIATQNWIFARFTIYFGFSNLILIPMLLFIFRKSERFYIYVSIILFYLAYYYYEQVVILKINYESIF